MIPLVTSTSGLPDIKLILSSKLNDLLLQSEGVDSLLQELPPAGEHSFASLKGVFYSLVSYFFKLPTKIFGKQI